jgi:predicted kinase
VAIPRYVEALTVLVTVRRWPARAGYTPQRLLVIFSGLSGVGKTAIARELARAIGAVHLRIDSIEQALRRAGYRVEGEGYEVAYAVAEDNLRAGRTVIADCVNPWPLTRAAWRSVAERAGVAALDVEIVCSDAAEHRRRVESREPDIAGHALPTWQDVVERDYHDWDRDRLVVDTAASDVTAGVRAIAGHLSAQA